MNRTPSSARAALDRPAFVPRGMSLIELLVALALMMLVVAAVGGLFAGMSRNRGDLERSDRLAENVQYATELLGDEIRHAGYFSEIEQTGVAWQTPNPCDTTLALLGFRSSLSAPPGFELPYGVVGYKLDEVTPVCVTNRRANTPAFVIRRLATEPTAAAAANNGFFVQTAKCKLERDAVNKPQWRIGTQTADFTLHDLDCTTVAAIRQVLVRLYYIADCNECGTDTTPTLKRVDLSGTNIVVTPLVEGVEDMSVEYGFDMDGDGDADRYLTGLSGTAGAADNDWVNVVGMRVNLLTRATDADPGYADTTKQYNLGTAGYTYAATATNSYKRTLASVIVRLNNPSMGRERP